MASIPLAPRRQRSSGSSATRRHAFGVALLCFFVLLVTRSHVLQQPPTWDGAMGMTPAALTLASSGFDVFELLKQPTYQDGGPNTHGTSLATLATAAVIRLAGSYASALPVLHLGSFFTAAVLVAGVYVLVARATGTRRAGLLAAGLTFLYPPFLVQASDVYLDLPLAAAMIWALVFAMEDRRVLTIVAATVAVWIKPTGVILLPALAYLMITAERDDNPVRRLAPLVIPTGLAAAIFLITSSGANSSETLTVGERLLVTLYITSWHTLRNPSLLTLFALSVIAPVTAAFRSRRTAPPPRRIVRLVGGSTLVVVSTLAFYFFNPLVTAGHALLPRYTVTLAPALVVLFTTSMWVRRQRIASAGVAVGCVVLVAAAPGWLTPGGPNNYALSERDLAYESHLAVQQRAIRDLEVLASELPVYVDHFTYFRFKYPEMGWVDDQPMHMTPVHLSEDEMHKIESMPDEFALLFEHPWLGGEILRSIWDAAASSGRHTVEVHPYESGGFENYVVVVRERVSS